MGGAARFEPFDAIKDVNEDGRQAAIALVGEGTRTPERKSYLSVNNRLEGCAPLTIEAVVRQCAATAGGSVVACARR